MSDLKYLSLSNGTSREGEWRFWTLESPKYFKLWNDLKQITNTNQSHATKTHVL